MTAPRSHRPTPIAAVLRGDASDAATLAWLSGYVSPGDDVHVTVPYRELLVGGLRWPAALRAADAHRDRARQRLASAIAELRALTNGAVDVNGSIVAARRPDLTADLTVVADLVVYSVPSDVPAAYAFAEACRCVTGTRELSDTRGGVVLVPATHLVEEATVVVPDLAGRLDDRVLTAAVETTARWNGAMRIIRPGSAAHTGSSASQATDALDREVRAWVDRCHPSTHPACVIEVIDEPVVNKLRLIGGTVGLVVVAPPGSARRAEVSDLACTALGELAVPVMIVNDQIPAAAHDVGTEAAPLRSATGNAAGLLSG